MNDQPPPPPSSGGVVTNQENRERQKLLREKEIEGQRGRNDGGDADVPAAVCSGDGSRPGGGCYSRFYRRLRFGILV
ncbi:hypothetical protein Hanom_Chr03g00216601 [Helianthus anomalus]